MEAYGAGEILSPAWIETAPRKLRPRATRAIADAVRPGVAVGRVGTLSTIYAASRAGAEAALAASIFHYGIIVRQCKSPCLSRMPCALSRAFVVQPRRLHHT